MRYVSGVKYLFIVSGLLILAGAAVLFQNTQQFIRLAHPVQGTVTAYEEYSFGGSTHYRPVVSYTDKQGQSLQFVAPNGDNPPAYLIGQSVEVIYVPGAEQQPRINKFSNLWSSAVLMAVVGMLSLAIGFGMLVYQYLKHKGFEYLKQNGTPVNAQFIAVEINEKLEINGQHPFRIQAMWQDPNSKQVYHFNSNDIWFDPSNYTKENLTVLIDSSNPHKYYMDTSFLPKKPV